MRPGPEVLRGLPHAQARRLALPAIASNVSVPLVGLVDTAVLGHASDATGLGAVGLGAAVMASVFWIFAFLRPGTTSLVGRALGAGNGAGALAHLRRAIVLALGLGGAWLVLQWLLVPPLTSWLASGAEASGAAVDYVLIRGLSLPAVLVTLAILGYFIGAHDTRSPLAVAITIAVLNIAGDLIAVLGLGWGARGAAVATVIAETGGVVVALVLLRRRLGAAGWGELASVRAGALAGPWGALMTMNAWLMMRSALLMGALTAVASLGSRLGADVLAANAILLQLMYLASYALDGYATAAEAMAAQRLGARDVAGLHRAFAATALAAAGIAAALALGLLLGRDVVIATLTDLPGVADAARATWWAAVAMPVVSGAAWMLDGVFLGAGRSRDMVVSMSAAVLGVFVPVVGIAIGIGDFSQAVLWGAFLGLNVMRAATLGARYLLLSRAGGDAWLGRMARSGAAAA